MRKIRFELSIAADRFLAYYNGDIRHVQVTSLDGEMVRFPAHALRPFLQHSGFAGLFEIAFDCHNRLVHLERVDLPKDN